MRILFVLFALLALAQCATREDRRFHVGAGEDALVIIGLAEAAGNQEPHYTMLWRLLDEDGAFTDYGGGRAIEASTNSRDTVRVRAIPGEFAVVRARPGVYALDSVFAVLSEQRLNYYAQGVIEGPQRPSFEVAAGEAVYVGIWEMRIDGASAVTQLWRLSDADLRAVVRAADPIVGAAALRQTITRETPCARHRIGNMSAREIC